MNNSNDSSAALSIPIHSDSLADGLLAQSPIKTLVTKHNIPLYQRSQSSKKRPFEVAGKHFDFALPVTFTPYASVMPCSARCWFCSEDLMVKNGSHKAIAFKPTSAYQAQLKQTLDELAEVPLGLSLSGLEITDSATWLLETLDTLSLRQTSQGKWQEKAAYTNAAGLAHPTSRQYLIDRLADFGLDRMEVSRHHFDPDANQTIMNFKQNQTIQYSAVFESVLQQLNDKLPVTLICIVQPQGINTFEQVEHYLRWANNLGVKKVIFRELCELPPSYKNNKTYKAINLYRQSIEPLVRQWLQSRKAEIEFFINGYYFWNANFRYGDMKVCFERSDYNIMNSKHDSQTIHKLVFFANGNLCSGWQPEKNIIYQAGVQ